MNAGDWTQVAIAIIMLLAATAAFITAYVNYRTRPLLIRTKEMHSEDLKRVLDLWIEELDFQGVPALYMLLREATDLNFAVEDNILFADLKNHVPRDIDLFGQWDAFKEQRRLFDDKRLALYTSIKKYLKLYGRLDVLSEFTDSLIGFSRSCADWLYKSVADKADGGKISINPQFQIETLPDGQANLRLYGDYFARAETQFSAKAIEELLTMTVAQIDQDEPGPAAYDLLTEARNLANEQTKLKGQRQALFSSIEAARAIPILTGNCEHIARAREPFWPWQKR